MKSAWLALLIFGAVTDARAAPLAHPSPHIVVLGSGTVKAPPDIARVTYDVRGEGASAESALKAMNAKRAAIEAGVAAIDTADRLRLNTGEVSVTEARAKVCGGDDYDAKPQLSEGDCKVRGYIAKLSTTVRVAPVKDAGTLVARASQLGASDVKIEGYDLSSEAATQAAALAAALADARTSATAIAAGAGVRLGQILAVEDNRAREVAEINEIMVTAQRNPAFAPPPAVMIPVPVNPEPKRGNGKGCRDLRDYTVMADRAEPTHERTAQRVYGVRLRFSGRTVTSRRQSPESRPCSSPSSSSSTA